MKSNKERKQKKKEHTKFFCEDMNTCSEDHTGYVGIDKAKIGREFFLGSDNKEIEKCICGSVQFDYAGRCLACKYRAGHKVKECEHEWTFWKNLQNTGYEYCKKCQALKCPPEPLQEKSIFEKVMEHTDKVASAAYDYPFKEDSHTRDWHLKFIELIQNKDLPVGTNMNDIKDFIENLLSSEKTRVREEIRQMIESRKLNSTIEFYSIHNQALDDILSSLENSK